MPESQALVKTRFVRYHTDSTEEGVRLAFPFMVVHEDEGEHLSGFVFAHDERNTAGLTDGDNWKAQVGRGGPDIDGSWSEFDEEEA